MCVIVAQPKGTTLQDDRLSRLWDRNKDGGGFAYIDSDDQLQVVKSMDKDEYIHKFKSARGRNPESDFLLHMRIATHGSVNLDNVHPFRVDEHTVMAHNGIIKIESAKAKSWKPTEGQKLPKYGDDPWDRSDTRIFVEEMLPELPENWLDNPMLVQMVEDFIGGSKLMFVTTNPKLQQSLYILNAKMGTVVDQMWFSNTHGVHPPKVIQASGWKPSASAKKQAKQIGAGSGSKYTKKITATTFLPENLKKDMSSLKTERFLKAKRHAMGLYNDIEFFASLDSWICFDCESEVSDDRYDAGECKCYDLFCTNCSNLPMDCQCQGTDRKLVEFTSLEEIEAVCETSVTGGIDRFMSIQDLSSYDGWSDE